MVNKFLIAIAAVVAVMAALVLAPGFNSNRQQSATTDQTQQVSLEYSRQQLARTESGSLAAAAAEVLTVENDGSATYTKVGGQLDGRKFTVSEEEMKQLRARIFGTGFMQIPETDYSQQEGLANFTKYTLKLQDGGDLKTISWVNPGAHAGTIPPIITKVGELLDSIISRHV